ncbi:phosphoribosyl-AMP cyclohydrolase [Aestuariivirga sp.]|uniref:phosphoribosyl-AMP cyclohydrolase n=1 Tax=Aestuariivirga sp. TaxID=2650926 RepID=UPI003BAC6FD4
MASDLDETHAFQPRFDRDGLIAAIVTDAGDGTVLMFAYMNAESLRLTQDTGIAHFWSRSRQALWKKGETSGEMLKVIEILTDCDQDVLQVKAQLQGKGAACHTGRRSCFYRRVEGDRLIFLDEDRLFDPGAVYGRGGPAS